jgi:GT2 family glycosyltransferase/glycosyltransferase involved in cell wall biosynthesis
MASPSPSTARTPMALVVVNYASHRLLEQNLARMDLTGLDVRIVVVDNRSTAAERSATQLLAARHGWDLVEMPDNRGFGAAVNAGIAAARDHGCASFLLLNPDAVIEPAVVAALHEHSTCAPLAMITPRIVDSAGATVFRGAHLDLNDGRVSSRGLAPSPAAAGGPTRARRPRTTPWVTAACVILHADLLDRMGGFDEDYFMYWEDVDLSFRCTRAGGTLVVRDDLIAVHDEGGTQGERRGRGKSALYYRYNCRNRLLFAAKNLDRASTLRWMLDSVGAGYQILLQGGRRQFVQSPRLPLAALGGTLYGLALAGRSLLRRERRRGQRSPAVVVVHPGSELYGSDRVLLESVEALRAVGADVEVILPATGPLEEMLKAQGVSVVHCPMPVLRKDALRPAGLFRLVRSAASGLVPAVRLLTRRPVDRLYVNTLTIPSWLVLGRLLGLRVVCHVHEAERSAPRLVRLLLAAPVALAHRVVVNSEFSLDVLAASIPWIRDRATVVYNAVPGPARPLPARPAVAAPLRLLYLGRLSPRKGPQVAVAATGILRDRGLDVQLQLLGSVFPGYEWFEAQLHDQVADGELTDRVEFLGFRADVWPHVQAADVILVPSVADEPFGNTAVEAVLAARPLVVSDSSGLREATAGLSSVVRADPARPDQWADAVQSIVDGWTEQVSLAERDATSAARRFSRHRYQDELAAVVLDSGRG